VRICANKIVAGERCRTLLRNTRLTGARQITSACDFDKLEGLALQAPEGSGKLSGGQASAPL